MSFDESLRLPEDQDAEKALLAAFCAPGAEDWVSEFVFRMAAEDFVNPVHRAVFEALTRLLETRRGINLITLKDELHQAGRLDQVGGYQALVELARAEDVGNPTPLVDLIQRKARLRKLVRLGEALSHRALQEEDPLELTSEIAQNLYLMAQGGTRAPALQHIDPLSRESMERLWDRLHRQNAPGVRVGFSRLDQLTQGFQPGNLVILAARPGIGKTSLALNWLWNSARLFNAHGAFFSLEMSKEEVFWRLLAAQAQVNVKQVQAGHLDRDTEQRLLEAQAQLARLPIFVCDQASITVPQIHGLIQKHLTQANQRLDFVIIDYLQLVSSAEGSRAAKQSEAVRVAELSRGLKLMAKDHGVPIVVLSQLNREVEHRTSGRPQLSDLRDSGAIEQDADIVAFIHRKVANAAEGQAEDQTCELIIEKHRNGPRATIPLFFQNDLTLFRELIRETSSEI